MEKAPLSVSVIVLVYNADKAKLNMTLRSILRQRNIDFEIIIADDGSTERLDSEMISLFNECGFENYSFTSHTENMGTCKNLFAALELVKSPLVKAISPGDALYDENTLSAWAEFMNKSDCDASFGKAVYYAEVEGETRIIKTAGAPKYPELYKEGRRKSLFVDYLLANDTILGASLMMKTEVIKHYLSLFVDRVKYAEDYMLRLAIFENKKVCCFPQNAIFYEYGLGISTAKSQKWAELLHKDFTASDALLLENCERVDAIAKRYARYLEGKKNGASLGKLTKLLSFPSLLYYRIKPRFSFGQTPETADLTFFNEVTEKK